MTGVSNINTLVANAADLTRKVCTHLPEACNDFTFVSMEKDIQQKERIYYLDWLRVSAFGILILFHCWQPFTNFHWLLSSENKSIVADIFSVFFHTWRLYLIFFISGIGTWIAINSRGSNFLKDRFSRLIIPFVFGVIVIVPCQYYYQMLQKSSEVTFLDFMSNYPKTIIGQVSAFDPFSWILEFGIHLWYLPSLFIMTLITLPLLKRININGLSEAFMIRIKESPKLVLLFSLPIIIIIIVLKPIFPDYTSVTDFLTYACSFVYGFIFIKEHSRLLPVVNKNKSILLALGILSSLTIIAFLLDETFRNAAFDPKYNIYHVIVSVPLGLSAFAWTLYFVSLFSRKFNFNVPILAELNKSILPVYILHQSIIVVAGYYIIKYVENGLLEFALIVLITIISLIVIYNFIKLFKATRFLFGMKN
ncbi:MAG: acyltransferase family protein [Cyclobacteriaceae bacterium]|nr:acyltransferase family protein [Cyclobacteriaceae bacterium]